MASHFPAGFVCNNELRENYPIVEKQLLPLIRIKATKLKRLSGYDFDDALQEGRIALLKAMANYDYNRGSLERYVSVVLDNTYNAILFERMSASRMPRVVYWEDDGWKQSPSAPVSLDAMMGLKKLINEPADPSFTPEQELENNQLEEVARVFRLKMFNSLKGRDLDVFVCKVNPPMDLLIMIRNMGDDYERPTNLHIAKYLGTDKNAVDWSLCNIREKFTDLCRQKEFSDLMGDTVRGKGWPMIHTSWANKHDIEFIQKVVAERNLDPKPLEGCHQHDDYLQKSGDDVRLIERYSWGCIMFLKYRGKCCTLVVEGKLNAMEGLVYGEKGSREHLPVNWYKNLVKELRTGGTQNVS